MPTNSDPTNRSWKPTSVFESRKLSFGGNLARAFRESELIANTGETSLR